jgi:hypothetical protein
LFRLEAGDDVGSLKTPVPSWSDGGSPYPPLADRAVQRLLADAKETGCLAGADQIGAKAVTSETSPKLLDVLGMEAAMASRSDKRRLEPALCDRAKNSRPADAKAVC